LDEFTAGVANGQLDAIPRVQARLSIAAQIVKFGL
jgi:hypothetical protein